MEVAVAVLSAVTSSVVTKLLAVTEKRWKELKDLEDDIGFLHRELAMISGQMEVQISRKGQPSAVDIISMEEFRALAHNIEDCLDRFLPCAACEGEQIHDPKKFRVEIARLKRELDAAHQRRDRYGVNNEASAAAAESRVDNSTADLEDLFACPAVGIEEAKQELCNSLVDGQASRKLRVISIVGFGGSGKTALAWQVYNCPQVAQQFTCRAWTAVSSKHKDEAAKEVLLTAILEGLLGKAAHTVPRKLRQLQQHICRILQKKRCLIVIDDIKMELWDAIKPIFPEETESRILVTTAVTSVANACSLPGGYVHNMRSLSAKQSKDYLEKMVFVDGCSPELERGSSAIVNKCDGHALALVSVAKALQGHHKLTGELCEEVTQNLCSYMEENKNGHFTKLGQVLMNHYCSLPGHALKTCLLYASVLPNDRPVCRKTLIRRWLAEGYVDDLEVANKKLDELIDRNIFRPIDRSNNGKAKTCKPHSIMHQFMLHKSMSSNFIATSFGAKNRSNFRHLIIKNHTSSTSSGMGHGTAPAERGRNPIHNLYTSLTQKIGNFKKKSVKEQLRARSLTVFGSAGEAVSDLTCFELLRVLDLKECDVFNEEHLRHIYKLLHLKYLTLGSSISNLSPQMERLHCLETLDLRKTKIETLPVEVISLPHLTHLLGKIKLETISDKNRKKFLQIKSNLQTLAGVVVDKNSGLPELMVQMKNLTNVKIWCETTSTDSNHIKLSEAIHMFSQAGVDTAVGARHLTLHLNDSSKDLLPGYLCNTNATSIMPGYLSSLKLQGSLSQFPQFVISLSGLKELCLTSTNLTGGDLLPDLFKLQFLVYLKLVEVHLADLDIKLGNFPSLQCLCLVVQEPKFPTIQEGDEPRLTSIQLLCKDLVGLCDHIKVECFKALQEIALDSMVSREIIELWKNEAEKHPKRPNILLLKRIDPADTRSVVKYVATDKMSSNPLVQGAP